MNGPILSATEELAVQQYARRLRALFGRRLVDLQLFGSAVHGGRWEESDIDILVLVDRLTPEEKRRAWNEATLLNIEADTLISPLVMSPEELEELRNRERRLALDIDREGVSICLSAYDDLH